MDIRKIAKFILSMPKTIAFNLKMFPIDVAMKLPVFLHYKVKIQEAHRGGIVLKDDIHTGMIKLGTGRGSDGVFSGDYPKASGGGYLCIRQDSYIEFCGSASFAAGFSLRVDNGGKLVFGDRFSCNQHCFFASNESVIFGDDCTLGWDVNIRDVDGHDIFLLTDSTSPANKPRRVVIGNHVWIASCSNILKGSYVPDSCVVAWGALLTGQLFEEENCIIGGNPPKILKRNIEWRK